MRCHVIAKCHGIDTHNSVGHSSSRMDSSVAPPRTGSCLPLAAGTRQAWHARARGRQEAGSGAHEREQLALLDDGTHLAQAICGEADLFKDSRQMSRFDWHSRTLRLEVSPGEKDHDDLALVYVLFEVANVEQLPRTQQANVKAGSLVRAVLGCGVAGSHRPCPRRWRRRGEGGGAAV